MNIDMEEGYTSTMPIIKESSNFYKFYAHGRINVASLFVGLYVI